jgi:hypothetical protein
MRATVWMTAGFVAVSWLGGCAQRTLTISSEPAGALVFLNDEEVGRTPVTVPFTFYGVYDVRLEAPGYQPLWTAERTDAPFWEFPGPDLIAEAVGAQNHIRWHFQMLPATPADEVDTDQLLDHARQLRALTRQEEPSPRRPTR